MAPLVVIEVALRAEGLAAAVGADVRSLTFVDHLVDGEVVLLAKGLSTAREAAFEWLCTCVQVDMGPQTVVAPEFLPAARMGASEQVFGPLLALG